MERITEPELMVEPDQVEAFATCDFAEVNQSYVSRFAQYFPDASPRAAVLDLCCGPGDLTLRFARANEGWSIDAVDGSRLMLEYAARASGELTDGRVRWIEATVPELSLPRERYDVVLCMGSLHHFHDPAAVWSTVRRGVGKGSIVFVTDFFRPQRIERAAELVSHYARDAPAILQRDYFNSLCAAFTPDELRTQLDAHGMPDLRVATISDRHVVIAGRIT
jgi:ubiquinone/menaquinone biosynthesis C-methylase UbiE